LFRELKITLRASAKLPHSGRSCKVPAGASRGAGPVFAIPRVVGIRPPGSTMQPSVFSSGGLVYNRLSPRARRAGVRVLELDDGTYYSWN